MQLTAIYGWATTPAQNADLKKQLAAAIATAAVQVLAEDHTTYNHEARVAWANSVLQTVDAPAAMADRMVWGVLGNTTIQADLTANGTASDGDIQFTVNSLVNTYAG